MNIAHKISQELQVDSRQVEAVIHLLDEGATVPFIARYRKEVTGGLDDTQLRTLHERLLYLREFGDRQQAILRSIESQGKLTAELEQTIMAAETKTELEDIYLPYKPKRRTKAQIAREAGIEPLALQLWQQPESYSDPQQLAQQYLNADAGFGDSKAVLDGARQILMEQWAEDATLSGQLRNYLWQNGMITATVVVGKEEEGKKFADYFGFSEKVATIPSHRFLALLRGRNEGVLQIATTLPEETGSLLSYAETIVAQKVGVTSRSSQWLLDTVRWTWKVKLFTRLENDIMAQLREQSEDSAIEVFARNLHDLLLAAPAGSRTTMGLDPGLRTGVKVAVVDPTGKLLDTATIYPHVPQKQWEQSQQLLLQLIQKHGVELISIGNGTASRETDKLVAELLQRNKGLCTSKIMVSEAGASVYSASELAANEFPDVDVSIRGAISIARRLQDPLAELVKIDPKSIGVGQYQHDVSQTKLQRSLVGVIEDCVNGVGVDINTASIALLSNVSGLNPTLAANIIHFRDQNGKFHNRKQLLQVTRLGPKAYEQCAGFLRIRDGDNPLDSSAVHPESYPVVEKISRSTGKKIAELIGSTTLLHKLAANEFTDERFGLPTVKDIIAELDKPGRDPRPEFTTASFKEGVESLQDLRPEMILEGVVTNITHFGAFVDVGVHQDGLVHISAMSDKFITDPHAVVKTGEIVKVKVTEVDVARKRIALTMRLTDQAKQAEQRSVAKHTEPSGSKFRSSKNSSANNKSQPAMAGALAAAFAKASGGR